MGYQQDFEGEELRTEGDEPNFEDEEAKFEGEAKQHRAKGKKKKRFKRERHRKWRKTRHRMCQPFLEGVMEVPRCLYSRKYNSPPKLASRMSEWRAVRKAISERPHCIVPVELPRARVVIVNG